MGKGQGVQKIRCHPETKQLRRLGMTPGEAGEAHSVQVMEGLGNPREGFGLAKGPG